MHDIQAPASPARVLTASMVGTAIEFYDFYIYGTAASLVFGPLFFPSSSASAQLLSAYASFAIAFIARPLGGAVFGHYGDRLGRKSTLVFALLCMGVSTVAIGFLPTYAQAGWLAPLLLCLMRFGQGFGLGGEWSGAALLALENAPPGFRARYAIATPMGAPVGFIGANGLFLVMGAVLGPDAFMDWGWRVPFLLSVVLVGVGLWIRLRLTETPEFLAARAEAPPARAPLGDVLRQYPREAFAGTFSAAACFAVFYLTTTFALGYGTTRLGYSRELFLALELGAILFMAASIIVAGIAADMTSPRRVLIVGCGATVGAGLLLAPMLDSGSTLLVFGWLALSMVAMGLAYGPLSAFLPDLFPARVRYTGSSIAFNVGGILGGGLAPLAAQALAERGGLAWVGAYLATAGLISGLALLSLKPAAP